MHSQLNSLNEAARACKQGVPQRLVSVVPSILRIVVASVFSAFVATTTFADLDDAEME